MYGVGAGVGDGCWRGWLVVVGSIGYRIWRLRVGHLWSVGEGCDDGWMQERSRRARLARFLYM